MQWNYQETLDGSEDATCLISGFQVRALGPADSNHSPPTALGALFIGARPI